MGLVPWDSPTTKADITNAHTDYVKTDDSVTVVNLIGVTRVSLLDDGIKLNPLGK